VLDHHRDMIDAARRQVLAAREASSRAEASASSLDGGRRPVAKESFTGYRLERVVHCGGQGEVYQAIQLSTGRTVALKVMRDGALASAADRVRFDREVQILGQLDHPNIVRIIDSGRSDGRHFLVMDFVVGVPLDRSRGEGASPSDAARETLRLFAEVCDAVHAAHLHGVIHRDLKPGNILVDSLGRPRVLDFGLARRIASAENETSSADAITQTGQFLGSLPWASPEQVSGDEASVDLRSDVYSLGVILYQLLTGAFPYRVSGVFREVTEDILHADPLPPSSRLRGIGNELDTVVLKALSKDPARRYQSAGDLARDIRHLLAGELIEAKRDSLGYVIWKQLQRHWVPAAVAATFIVVILAAMIMLSTLWRVASEQRDLKEAQRLRAESISAMLQRILGAADPESSRGIELTVAEVLGGAVAELDAGALRTQPEVEVVVRRTLGQSYLGLGALPEAQEQLDAALALGERVHGRLHAETARTLAALGRLALLRGDASASVQRLREALGILDREPSMAPDAAAEVMMTLASALSRLQRSDEVAALHERALAQMSAAFGADHPETVRTRLAIETHRNGGTKALELLEQRLELDRQTRGPRHPETLRTMTRIAAELHLKGRTEEAEQAYLEALSLANDLHRGRHQDLLQIVTNLHWLYEHTGQVRKACALLEQWEPSARITFGPQSVMYANYLMLWGHTMARSEDAAHGEALLRRALEMMIAVGVDQGVRGADCRVRLARVMLAKGSDAEVERLAREVLAIGADDSDMMRLRHAQARVVLGEVLANRGEFAQAEPLLLAAHETLAPRRSMPNERTNAVRQLAALYEAWDAAEPGAGRAEDAAAWRAAEAALVR